MSDLQLQAVMPNQLSTGTHVPTHFASLDNKTTQIQFSLDVAGNNLSKYLTLRHVQDQDEHLFFHYIRNNIKDSLPYIYTPSVGDACQKYSYLNILPRGIYFSYRSNESVASVLEHITDNIDIIVITDGSRVLGLGDQGIGGMGISVGKLSLYTAVGGISPDRTLPVCIDVGTNNPELKNDPHYLGDKEDRINDQEFYAYLDEIMQALSEKWPNAIIQFEDFSNNHAYPLLDKYRDHYRCFNDDIQGTATVSSATIKRALLKLGKKPETSRVFIVGAGSAGCGIADLIQQSFGFQSDYGVYVFDRDGLLFDDTPNLSPAQKGLTRSSAERPKPGESLCLQDAIKHYQPDVLVGVTGVSGLFDEKTVKAMAASTQTPVIMPLSNPTSACEVTPQQVYEWSNGDAFVATGSPFPPVSYKDERHTISQCNNVYVFPGIGLGAKAVNAKVITNGMLLAAVEALAVFECHLCSQNEVLPAIENSVEVSKAIAIAVAKRAIEEGVSELTNQPDSQEIVQMITQSFWSPKINAFIA